MGEELLLIIEGAKFWWCMFFLFFIIFYQYMMFKRSKRNTDPRMIFILHVVVPLAFLIPVMICVPSAGGGFLMFIAIILSYLWLTKSEQWFRLYMTIVGEYNVNIKFLNHEAEQEYINLYRVRHQETKQIPALIRTNIEIIERMTNTEFYRNVIDTYLDIHPEITSEEIIEPIEEIDETNGDKHYLEMKSKINQLQEQINSLIQQQTKKRPKKNNSKPRKTTPNSLIPISNSSEILHEEGSGQVQVELTPKEIEEIDQETQIQEEKETVLQIFQRAFGDCYFHRVFGTFHFLQLDLDEDISSDIQLLILSSHEALPHDLRLTCGLLSPEKVQGKKFTTIFGVEGILDEEIAKKINIRVNDLEIFKEFPSFFQMDVTNQRMRGLEYQIEEWKEEYNKMFKDKLRTSAVIERASRFKARETASSYKKRGWKKQRNEEDVD